MTEARVTMQHLRSLKFCAHGARAWCERYGFDWRELVLNGLPAQAVADTGDSFGIRAAALAVQEAGE